MVLVNLYFQIHIYSMVANVSLYYRKIVRNVCMYACMGLCMVVYACTIYIDIDIDIDIDIYIEHLCVPMPQIKCEYKIGYFLRQIY